MAVNEKGFHFSFLEEILRTARKLLHMHAVVTAASLLRTYTYA